MSWLDSQAEKQEPTELNTIASQWVHAWLQDAIQSANQGNGLPVFCVGFRHSTYDKASIKKEILWAGFSMKPDNEAMLAACSLTTWKNMEVTQCCRVRSYLGYICRLHRLLDEQRHNATAREQRY